MDLRNTRNTETKATCTQYIEERLHGLVTALSAMRIDAVEEQGEASHQAVFRITAHRRWFARRKISDRGATSFLFPVQGHLCALALFAGYFFELLKLQVFGE